MDEEITLHPTGTCFDDAIEYINMLSSQKPWYIKKYNKLYRVVHGICNFEDGSPYAHCWLEKGDKILDFRFYQGEKVMVEYTISEFLRAFAPQRYIKYTLKDCCELERAHGHPGPWDPTIIQLCKDVKEQIL